MEAFRAHLRQVGSLVSFQVGGARVSGMQPPQLPEPTWTLGKLGVDGGNLHATSPTSPSFLGYKYSPPLHLRTHTIGLAELQEALLYLL